MQSEDGNRAALAALGWPTLLALDVDGSFRTEVSRRHFSKFVSFKISCRFFTCVMLLRFTPWVPTSAISARCRGSTPF